MYRSYPVYSPLASHDWQLNHKEKRTHRFDEFDEFDAFHHNGLAEHEYQHEPVHHGAVDDSLNFKAGLRRMDFEGLTEHDRHTKKEHKAAIDHHQPCKCVHGTEECCEFEVHEHEDLLEYFEAPTPGHTFHKAHYCISGDEPECEHLRQEEEQTMEKKRRQYHEE